MKPFAKDQSKHPPPQDGLDRIKAGIRGMAETLGRRRLRGLIPSPVVED